MSFAMNKSELRRPFANTPAPWLPPAVHKPSPQGPREHGATGPAAKVLVAHSSMLIAAGLARTLERQWNTAIRIWGESEGPWISCDMNNIDLVFADSECLRLMQWSDDLDDGRDGPGPEIIWMTTTSDAAAVQHALPSGIRALLPVDCGEQDLFETLGKLNAACMPALSGAVRSRPTGGLAPGAMKRVLEHVERHLAEHIELCDLAKLADLSNCHFARAFKQSVGMPPHRYLMTRRISAAAELIVATSRVLSDIALEVGFCDQSHFTRVFTAQIGESPSRYRRQRR